MHPKISVLMPVWNGEKYLSEALESVFGQSFTDFELLVVDDGSTDSTPAILAACQDPRLRVFRLEHAGIVNALNHGIANARAEWIARQDADDISHPDRLAKQWAAVSRNPRAILCHTDVEFHGKGSLGISAPRFTRTMAMLALKLCYHCPVIHSTVMFRKDAVLSVGSYKAEERHAEDFGLWGRLLVQGDFVGLPERLLRFRIHTESISHQKRETQIAVARQIAINHCVQFMNIPPAEASLAFETLSEARENCDWSKWNWFLLHCLPRLRWKSAEVFAWVFVQTARMGIKSIRRKAM